MMKTLCILVLVVLVVSKDFSCEEDDDCNPPYELCDTDNETCHHKQVFPMEALEFFGCVVLAVILALCNAAGIGGGGMIVPICIILFQFDTTHAIALSNFNIFISSIVRFFFNFKQKHPLRSAVSVNYEIVMIMLPCVLAGGMLGV